GYLARSVRDDSDHNTLRRLAEAAIGQPLLGFHQILHGRVVRSLHDYEAALLLRHGLLLGRRMAAGDRKLLLAPRQRLDVAHRNRLPRGNSQKERADDVVVLRDFPNETLHPSGLAAPLPERVALLEQPSRLRRFWGPVPF